MFIGVDVLCNVIELIMTVLYKYIKYFGHIFLITMLCLFPILSCQVDFCFYRNKPLNCSILTPCIHV